MNSIWMLTRRDAKVYFRDKGLFFTSLVTPLILLILFVTFLADVYKDSFTSGLPAGFAVPDGLPDAMAGAQACSSLLATSCVTVAFCANLVMISDKANGARKDLLMSPVKRSYLAISYFLASGIATLIVTFAATGLSFVYLAIVGWYLSVSEALLFILDVFLLTLFGVSLSAVVNSFLRTQAQASATGAIVSSAYGFLCGAYMPLSSSPEWLQNALMFLPGTYGTSLLRNNALAGIYRELEQASVPEEAISALRESVDCDLYFFGAKVEQPVMYVVLVSFIVLCTVLYLLLDALRKEEAKR